MPDLRRWRRLACACLFVVCLAVLHVAAAGEQPSWPQWHGPNRDNISTETGLLKKWPEGGPRLLWQTKGLGFGYSTVVIADGRIVTTGNMGEDCVITAMNMSGKVLWRAKNGKAWQNPYPGTRGTPIIEGDRIYHEGAFGDVICLDAKTGKEVWTVNILERFESKNIRWALAESLLVNGDRVICTPSGPEASVVALDKKTGKTVWTAPSAGDLAGYASPILAEYEGLRIIVALTSHHMIGVNADTGDLLWKVRYTSLFDENVLTPIFRDGHIYVSCLKTGTVKWKVNVKGKTASVKQVWHSEELDNHHGDVILLDGYLYGASTALNRQKWICLDAETGGIVYAVAGVGKGAVTCADGKLYIMSEKGRVGLMPASPMDRAVISSFQVPGKGKGKYWAHPVVCGGRLYIRHGGLLYVYDIRGK